jgi:hypothetical protein
MIQNIDNKQDTSKHLMDKLSVARKYVQLCQLK